MAYERYSELCYDVALSMVTYNVMYIHGRWCVVNSNIIILYVWMYISSLI